MGKPIGFFQLEKLYLDYLLLNLPRIQSGVLYLLLFLYFAFFWDSYESSKFFGRDIKQDAEVWLILEA